MASAAFLKRRRKAGW